MKGSRSDSPLVVVVCGDAGGANAVAPVIEALLTEKRVRMQAFAYLQARQCWSTRGLPFQELSERTTVTKATEVLECAEAALVMTGTSFNHVGLENVFVSAARMLGIPTLAVLDFWSNYALRFANGDGQLAHMPDLVAVMDEQARNEAVAEGISSERIVITGQPAFDELIGWRAAFGPRQRKAIREALSVGSRGHLVTFVSQPLRALFGTDPASPLYPGYHEQEVLRSLIDALDGVAELHRLNVVLAVRPHPREVADAYLGLQSKRITVAIPTMEISTRNLLMASDLTTGMTSVALVEACFLGCITVSLQPGLRTTDVLPTNHWGVSHGVYQETDIRPCVERALVDPETRSATRARLSALSLDPNATQRVAGLIYKMSGLE